MSKCSEQLEHEVEKMGCRLNAYTSREQTVFYANVLKEDLNKVRFNQWSEELVLL
jgi:predicted Zn-dependent peptidase